VPLELIRRDPALQLRASVDPAIVREYAEQGAELDEIDVFFDGTDYWLADGHQRVAAWELLGWTEIPCRVRQGTREDALLFALGANAKHGVQLTLADRRRKVLTCLEHSQWGLGSDHDIAAKCKVNRGLVAKVRAEHDKQRAANGSPSTVRVTSDGRTMETANIGRGKGKGKASPNGQAATTPEEFAVEDADVAPEAGAEEEELDLIEQQVEECPLFATLSEPQRSVFITDARLYFEIEEHKRAIHRLYQKMKKDRPKDQTSGGYEDEVLRFFTVKPPGEWKQIDKDCSDRGLKRRGYVITR
jgi:hypothetical protein